MIKNLENKVPPLLVVLLVGLLVWPISRFTFHVNIADAWRYGLTIAVLGLGVFFCVAGVISFKRSKTTVNPLKPETASALVSSGIYQYTRNPMYVGFALFLLAWSVFLLSPVSVLGVVLFVLYMNRFQIQPEEKALHSLFGEEFQHYCHRVRRWI